MPKIGTEGRGSLAEAEKVITRRDFIKAGSYVAVGGIIGFPLLGHAAIQDQKKSRVVLVRHDRALDREGRTNRPVLKEMLDQAVTALMGTTDPLSGWRQLFRPDDIVGIKSNVWHRLPTPRELETAIKIRLQDAGLRESNIAADDRGVLQNPVFREATGLINVRPMRTHHWAGLGTLIKNYIMFVRTPWTYHGNACESLGAIWRLPHVKGKTRLNILVMLTPLFHGIGPHHFSPAYTWRYCGLIMSRDPVAADTTGARIIQAKRDAFFGTHKPISPPPLHIQAAETKYGLGHSRAENIQLIKLGWQDQPFV